MVNYSNGKIYKLVCGDLTYYGSTIQPLHKRLHHHKCQYKQPAKKITKSIQLFNLSIETNTPVKIYLVEKYPCDDKMELERRERYYIENYECVNKQIPTRTIKEWREANRNNIQEYHKQYYETNRNKKLEYQKQYDKANKDNKREYQKQYRERKYQCVCGSVVRSGNKSAHFKTKKHQDYINSHKD